MTFKTRFAREETKFECSYSKARNIEKQLFNFGLKKELFDDMEGLKSSTRIFNIPFENLEEIEKKNYDFNNYSRIRIRKYADDRNCFWLEIRTVKGVNVTKKRVEIQTKDFLKVIEKQPIAGATKIYSNLLKTMKKRNLKPYLIISYERTALISKDNKIRITIDKNIRYHRITSYSNLTSCLHGWLIGKEHTAIIKFKSECPLPTQIKEMQKALNAPRSKMQRARYFLRRSRLRL